MDKKVTKFRFKATRGGGHTHVILWAGTFASARLSRDETMEPTIGKAGDFTLSNEEWQTFQALLLAGAAGTSLLHSEDADSAVLAIYKEPTP